MTTSRRPRRSWGTLRRRASGRWEASYQGPDLTRHSAPATFSAKMDGEHWLAEERRLIERGQWTPPKARAAQRNAQGVTLSEYAGRWIEQRNLKQGSAWCGLRWGEVIELRRRDIDDICEVITVARGPGW
jgi:hypothetical protein